MRPERTGVRQDKKIRANRSRQKHPRRAGVRFGPDLAPCAWTGEGRDGKCEGGNDKCEFLARENANLSPILA